MRPCLSRNAWAHPTPIDGDRRSNQNGEPTWYLQVASAFRDHSGRQPKDHHSCLEVQAKNKQLPTLSQMVPPEPFDHNPKGSFRTFGPCVASSKLDSWLASPSHGVSVALCGAPWEQPQRVPFKRTQCCPVGTLDLDDRRIP